MYIIIVPIFLALVMGFVGCKNGSKSPNVENINATINFTAFDKILFSVDTTNITQAISFLKANHAIVFADYATYVCRTQLADTQKLNMDIYAHLTSDRIIYDSAIKPFLPNIDFLKKDIEQTFKLQKYYFPSVPLRTNAYTYYFDPIANNGTNYLGITLGEKSVGFGMQFFMGNNFEWYADKEFGEIAPTYRSRRFTSKYMVADMVQKIIETELYKPAKGKNNLIDQMIEKGKQWYIKKRLLPNAPDSIITGFTQYQLKGCKNQEGLLWKIVITADPSSNDPEVIRSFLGEAPYATATGNIESPGNIGQWIGWQIVEQYAEVFNTLNLKEILEKDSQEILDNAKYRPK